MYKIPKDVKKAIDKERYYSIDQFVDDVKRYIKACDENRIICNIDTVSSSGMSRTLKFVEHVYKAKNKRGYLLNFYGLFEALGYSKVRDSDYFRVHGCGMDMVFNTNYVNINNFKHMGFIRKSKADTLAQNTPSCI